MFGFKFPARVVRVLDGDTIEVEFRRKVRLRLLDCWAPETRTKNKAEKAAGYAARDFLADLVDGHDLSVEVPLDPDPSAKFGDATSMGRVLARCFLEDGRDVSAAVVAAGHATKDRS